MLDCSTFLTINNCSAVAIEGTAVNNCLHTLLILVDSREVLKRSYFWCDFKISQDSVSPTRQLLTTHTPINDILRFNPLMDGKAFMLLCCLVNIPRIDPKSNSLRVLRSVKGLTLTP